jgi:hypothetical protein
MVNDIPYIQAVCDQYNGQIPLRTVSEVDYSRIDTLNKITLIFQGTANLEDIKRDLEAEMIESGFGRVHSGSHSGLREVFIAEQPTLSLDAQIVCIGHSLGAMEAGDFACILYLAGYHNIEVVTFGCPRWGDADAMRYFYNIKSRTYRNYLNLFAHDFFTTIPPHLLLNPYQEVPNQITGWSAPTITNEWKTEGILIEAHSAEDCYLPLVTRLCS